MEKNNAATMMIPTGVPGLDQILRGGLPKGHIYLVEGDAGAGKTTLGLQFLLAGKRAGERTLWISLSESEAQIRGTALSHGWDLFGVEICNLTRATDSLSDAQYSFFSPADIELEDVAKAIIEVDERLKPDRIVFDPFSDVRLLARDALRYRRQLLQLREHFVRRGATVLLIQERTSDLSSRDPSAEGIVQGIIALYQEAPLYGAQRRRLRVLKLRGVAYREGFHDIAIETGGLRVFPRLIAADYAKPAELGTVSTTIPELDQMLGGGLDRGASLLILGPAGVGKSTIIAQFAVAAATRGERAAIYLFDETLRSFTARADGLGMDLTDSIARGQIIVRQLDPAEFSPGEFASSVQDAVEQLGVTTVLMDSLNGYLNGMTDEQHLSKHMHELLTYLSHKNVITILTVNQHGFMGGTVHAPIDLSYLADGTMLLRYFEAEGAVRRAASVIKRRYGPHEVHIRELSISSTGLQVGRVITEFTGLLSGQPRYTGTMTGLGMAQPANGGGK